MKPIRIRFSGLQSYRDEQDINLEHIGSLGLFGIFGPTGSGKSTILDAITLALYGNVERAKGGTQGIINQFSEKLTVSFVFLLGENKYTVERSYVRNKDNQNSAQNKNARLMQITEHNTEVLADKSSEVNKKLEEILGMNFNDFTRAVIIPQNKFDQFLKLTGGERAKMLENIFCLEEYGEKLANKTKELKDKLKNELTTNEKLIDQLGDASDEALAKVEESLCVKRSEVKKKAIVKKSVEDQLNQLEQLAVVNKELEELKKRRTDLEETRPLIDEDREKLKRAKSAEPLRSSLKLADELMVRKDKEQTAYADTETNSKKIYTDLKRAEVRLTEAKRGEVELNKIKETELPKLSLIKDYQEQLEKLQAEVAKSKGLILDKSSKITQIATEIENKSKEVMQIHESSGDLRKKQQRLQQLLDCRAEVERASSVLVQLENEEKNAKDAQNRLEKRKQALQREEKQLRTILADKRDLLGADPDSDRIQHLIDLVPDVIRAAREKLKQAEDELNNAREQNMANVLADRLEDGKACQVCGSTEHPQPAKGENIDDEEIAQAKSRLMKERNALEELHSWENNVNIKYNTYQNIEQEIKTTLGADLAEKENSLKAARESFAMEATELGRLIAELLPGFSSSEPDSIKVVKKQVEAADKENKQISLELEKLDQRGRQLEGEAGSLRESQSGLRVEVKGLSDNQLNNNEAINSLTEKVNIMTGGLTPSEFEQQVKKKIAALENELVTAQSLWESSEKKRQEIEQKLISHKTSLDRTSEQLESILTDLNGALLIESFESIEELRGALIHGEIQEKMEQKIQEFDKAVNYVEETLKDLQLKLETQPFDEKKLIETRELLSAVTKSYDTLVREEGALETELKSLQDKKRKWEELQVENTYLTRREELTGKLFDLLKGRKFVQFLAEEHIKDMAIEASMRLGTLTGQRYALELDESFGFVMRDDYSNGARRPVNTLSGGETFLTSLSLALALSSKIQLKGEHPLGFFFLDEGFGTLDPEKLESVMSALEKLHQGQRMVGVITHVPELRTRMPRYLEIVPAKQNGTGSKVLEKIT